MNLKLTVKTDIPDLYRGIIESKKGYRCRTDTVKDRKGDFVTEADSILAGEGTTSVSC
jgi:hypothetical protein